MTRLVGRELDNVNFFCIVLFSEMRVLPLLFARSSGSSSGQTAAEDVLQGTVQYENEVYMVAVNSSWVGHLETGSDVDCPISSFIIEFSTRVYLSHLPLNKLIIKKPPSEQ